MYRSHRGVHFPAFRAEYFTLIHSDLENYDSALEKDLLFICMDYGYRLKLRSEQKGWSFGTWDSNTIRAAAQSVQVANKANGRITHPSQKIHLAQEKQPMYQRLNNDPDWEKFSTVAVASVQTTTTDLYWQGSRSQLSVRIQHPADYRTKYCRG